MLTFQMWRIRLFNLYTLSIVAHQSPWILIQIQIITLLWHDGQTGLFRARFRDGSRDKLPLWVLHDNILSCQIWQCFYAKRCIILALLNVTYFHIYSLGNKVKKKGILEAPQCREKCYQLKTKWILTLCLFVCMCKEWRRCPPGHLPLDPAIKRSNSPNLK